MNTIADAVPIMFAEMPLEGAAPNIEKILFIRAEDYISEHYSKGQQIMLTSLLAECGVVGNLPNRAAYIQSGLNWCKTVLNYTYTTVADVYAAASTTEALALDWNLSTFDASDPETTIAGALALND
jgi:hypothetical protein